jgi:hypothetical protein
VVEEYAADIALFGGQVGGRTMALLGSSESVIGVTNTSSAQHAPFYYTLRFLNDIAEGHAPLSGKDPPYYSWEDAIKIGLRALPPTDHRLEFLAKVIHVESGLVVGTPLYVALAV